MKIVIYFILNFKSKQLLLKTYVWLHYEGKLHEGKDHICSVSCYIPRELYGIWGIDGAQNMFAE